jgi:hypothetical protein
LRIARRVNRFQARRKGAPNGGAVGRRRDAEVAPWRRGGAVGHRLSEQAVRLDGLDPLQQQRW